LKAEFAIGILDTRLRGQDKKIVPYRHARAGGHPVI
jgi:hypothetical protein